MLGDGRRQLRLAGRGRRRRPGPVGRDARRRRGHRDRPAHPGEPPTSPATPPDATSGPAPALYPAARGGPAVGVGLSPSQFGLDPFPLLNGATVGALTPFVVGAGMTVPAAASGGGATVTTGTDANSIGYTTTTIDSYSFGASLAPDAAGGLTYEETYSFSYDIQTVPAATGGASVHDWVRRATPSLPTTTTGTTPSP